MKNMKKVLAVMTAVSAMAASTSAFAANTAAVSTFKGLTTEADIAGLTATYDLATNDFDVVLGESFAPTGDMTLLILDKDMTAEEEANVQDGDIRYIDQGTAFANAGLKLDTDASELAPGTYKVKVGYDDGTGFAIAVATITVEEVADNKKTLTFKWGDITLDGSVDVSDTLAVLYYGANDARTYSQAESEDSYTVGTTYGENKWGDITLDGSVDVSDALAVLYYGANDARTYEEYTVGTSCTVDME